MLQTGTICYRNSDGNFLLGKFGFMKNLAEGQPAVDFGWRWGGSSAGEVLGSCGSLDGIVEVRLTLLKVDGWGGSADTGGDRPL